MQAHSHIHPIHAHKEGVFNTITGQLIHLAAPAEEAIHIEDIAASLSKICRFNGHTNHFYSVAQHSIFVAAICPQRVRLQALLHDAAEAYLGDVISPLKYLLGAAYKNLETNFETVIYQRFGVSPTAETTQLVKAYDTQALEMEHEWLQCGNDSFIQAAFAIMGLQQGNSLSWQPAAAEKLFLNYFNRVANA